MGETGNILSKVTQGKCCMFSLICRSYPQFFSSVCLTWRTSGSQETKAASGVGSSPKDGGMIEHLVKWRWEILLVGQFQEGDGGQSGGRNRTGGCYSKWREGVWKKILRKQLKKQKGTWRQMSLKARFAGCRRALHMNTLPHWAVVPGTKEFKVFRSCLIVPTVSLPVDLWFLF